MKATSLYDKQRVARYFARAARTYTHYDRLQRGIADALLQRLSPLVAAESMLLDLGCGPAHHQEKLSQLGGHYLGMDITPAMLTEAQRHNPSMNLVAADMEQLPLRRQSVGLLFSNLAMQWSNDLSALLAEWYRVLAPGAQIAASTVLAGSLQPLGDCFTAVDGQRHTNQWLDFSAFVTEVQRLPWQIDCEVVNVVQEFPTVETMLHELKGVGANYTARSATGLYGRERFLRLKQALEQHRNANGMLELHWRIGLLSGVKPIEEN
ncbi:methyltransferase domain-containing protein [Pseudidiomarina homiensis]|uniref:methyltransferase domain-containing protein n=1 Tax=Pseudidiomarina homiensis TaxID=364198 RepID=UPI00215A9E9F|nr:methyltransferase domain-containing protein [Pseudidiomarina homiensis]